MATPLAKGCQSDIQEQVEGSPPERPKIGVQKPALPKGRVGYECEFVERPPDVLQTDCPVCLLIVREPNQVTCCGYSFCRACIDRVVTSKKPCPTCNEAEFDVFPDKRLQRSLYQFCVRCEHQQEGCEWSGELGQLDKHLNENPGLGNQLDGCEFTRVACIHCIQLFESRLVTAHQIGSCPRRPFSCDYCGDCGADCEDVVTKHWPVCGYRPVPCPNECGVYPERRNVHDHVNKDCPLTVVVCDFHYAGCQVRLPRRDILSHLNENLSSHMALMGVHSQRMAEKVVEKDEQIDEAIGRLTNELSKIQEVNEQRINELEKENRALRHSLKQKEEESKRAHTNSKRDYEALSQEVTQLRNEESLQKLRPYVPTFPIEFTMTNFTQLKRDDVIWYSEPFYTHPFGYKMCLKVSAGGIGDGKGTHLPMAACLMRGEFDNHLKWPLRAHVTFRLLNQLEDREHCEDTLMFSSVNYPDIVGRVISGERAKFGAGKHVVIPYSQLGYDPAKNCQYLKDDCLRFQVTRVTNLEYTAQLERRCSAIESRVYTDAIVPPVDFTMIDFNQQQQDEEVWYSLPFYTHTRGYRMGLSVYANGYGGGTHVTVYVHLMQGEFDDHLKWPFRGDITIQLLNQLEDKDHHTMTIPFTDTTPDNSAGRVTTGEKSKGWGYDTFIAHGELNHNSAKNCQHLKNDRLCFRVTKVELKT